MMKPLLILLLAFFSLNCGDCGDDPVVTTDTGTDLRDAGARDATTDTPTRDTSPDIRDMRFVDMDMGRDIGADVAPDLPEPEPPVLPATFDERYKEVYENQGVDPANFDKKRLSLITGTVTDGDGNPLPDATVSSPRHPEFGTTTTDENGEFIYAVNGGGHVTVRFRKADWIPSDRRAHIKWNAAASIGTVALLPYSTKVTTIDFSDPFQVAEGEVETDADGPRKAAVMFEQNTAATLVMPDGSEVAAPTLNVRLTEYTVGVNGRSRMPGTLPETSAYTYAVELSADEAVSSGATQINFDKTVYLYVEDFLGFPAGVAVPVGYYDRQRLGWVPSNDGIAIKVISLTNGIADIDIDGDDVADSNDDLEKIELTVAERERIAATFAVGKVLWRSPLTHFTPVDCNYPYRYPPGAEPPEEIDSDDKPSDDDCKAWGSVIDCDSRTIREYVDVPGTPAMLWYNSYDAHYQPAYEIEVPISPPARLINGPLACVVARVEIAERTYLRRIGIGDLLQNQSDKFHTFVWDGKDAFGNPVQGLVPYVASLEYLYQAVPVSSLSGQGGGGGGGGPSSVAFPQTFAQFANDEDIIFVGGRSVQEGDECVTLGGGPTIGGLREAHGLAGRFTRGHDLGGWTLSIHHAFDPTLGILYRGDGERETGLSGSGSTISGTGSPGSPRDGAPGIGSPLTAYDVEVGQDGTLYLGLGHPNLTTLKDDVYSVSSIRLPHDVNNIELGPNDTVYFSDGWNISKIDESGQGTPILGGNTLPDSDDYTGLANETWLGSITDFVVTSDGTIYVAARRHSVHIGNVIWRITQDGVISRFSGRRDLRDYVDHGSPASNASFNATRSLFLDETDRLHVVDNYRIYRLDPDNRVAIVAGSDFDTGQDQVIDGKSPTSIIARFSNARFDHDGRLYFTRNGDRRLYRVVDGVIEHAAFSQLNRGWDLELRAATAMFGYAAKFAFDAENTLYFANATEQYLGRLEANNQLTTTSEDGTLLYSFTRKGRHLKTRDRLTGATIYDFGYDAEERLINVTDTDGLVTTIERDTAGLATAIVGPYGHRTELTHDADGRLAQIENPNLESVQFTYDSKGLLQTMVDAKGQTKSYEFNDKGELAGETDAAGSKMTMTGVVEHGYTSSTLRSQMGREVTHDSTVEADRSGVTRTRTTTDSAGFVTTTVATEGKRIITYPDGRQTTVSFKPSFDGQTEYINRTDVLYPSGRVFSAQFDQDGTLDGDPDKGTVEATSTVSNFGRTVTTAYDGATRTLTVTSPQGRVASQVYDANGRVIRTETAGFHPTDYVYDADGRIESVTQAGRTIAYTYDGASNVDSLTNALNQTTTYDHDAIGRTVLQTLQDSRANAFDYDENGNLTSLIPASGNAHQWGYTPVDLVSNYDQPAIQNLNDPKTHYLYNDDHDPTRITLADGRIIGFIYDTAGRLTKTSTSAGDYDLTYSGVTGQVTSLRGPNAGQVSWTYDGNLVTGRAFAQEDVSAVVTWDYDGALRMTEETIGTDPIRFQYDRDDLLTRADQMSFTRNANTGLVEQISLAQSRTHLTFDGFGQVTDARYEQSSSDIFQQTLTYNIAGQITGTTEIDASGNTNFVYTYDDTGRLSEVTQDGNLIDRFTYDANDNLTERFDGTDTVIATYDDQDRLISRGTQIFRYNAHGQLQEIADNVSGDITNINYDVFDNLRDVTLPDGTQIDYLIDATGNRVGKKVDGIFQRGWIYGAGISPIAETDATGAVTKRFVWGERNAPEFMLVGSARYRFVTDHLGSIRKVVHVSTGVVEQELTYDTWGRVLTDTNPGFQPFAYAGGLYDPDTGWHRFGARDYDPVTARWTSKDPAGFAGGDTNLYAYASSDPINFIDPTGNAAWAVAAVVVLTVIDVASTAYNVYTLANENIVGDCDNLAENLAPVILDGVGLAIPHVAALGLAFRGAANLAKRLCSFAEGTMVTMCNGTEQPIETIQEGDLVLSKDEQTGQLTCQTVQAPYSNPDREIYELTLVDETGTSQTIETTANHPFYVDGRGWTRVDELKPGQWLATLDGIAHLDRVHKTERLDTVYNFAVSQTQSYYADGAWVHNNSCGVDFLVTKTGQAVRVLDPLVARNIRTLRKWAESKGFERVTTLSERAPERWNNPATGKYALKIKTQKANYGESKAPRFEAKLGDGDFVNPFTGARGNKKTLSHEPLGVEYF